MVIFIRNFFQFLPNHFNYFIRNFLFILNFPTVVHEVTSKFPSSLTVPEMFAKYA